MKKESGITLIALVITIIVLLILAGVSISMVAGDNGIASNATSAKEKTRAADMQDLIDLAVSENELSKYSEGETKTKEELIEKFVDEGKLKAEEASTLANQDTIEIGGIVVDFSKLSVDNKLLVENVQGKVLSTTDNTEIYDNFGNKIIVPAGFKVTTDANNVTEGIVIEDGTYENTLGSQFVWIPVGKVYTNTAQTSYETITLGGYQNFEKVDGEYVPSEEPKSAYQITNIDDFASKANNNGGYYIGRYEASASGTTIACKENEHLIEGKQQTEVLGLAQNMYGSDIFSSDLINEYAWDTAIIFIQTFGGTSAISYYSNTSYSLTIYTTGTSGDEWCNINDLAGGYPEWTTGQGIFRSAQFAGIGSVTPKGPYFRNSDISTWDGIMTFRPILYL